MNLIIDVGNTYTKLAVFELNKLIEKKVVETETILENVQNSLKKYHALDKAILSSVGKVDRITIDYLKNSLEFQILSHKSKLPFKNLYETPKTLGIDRIGLVCAAIDQFPGQNVLIIDAGTCITFDFINSKNEYLGGAISPGINMRYRALHNQTAGLPLLDVAMPKALIGNSTVSSIHSGVVSGVLHEIDGNIESYKRKFPDLTVILTGGNTKMLSKELKSSIFANSNFLLEGLNFILQYNLNR